MNIPVVSILCWLVVCTSLNADDLTLRNGTVYRDYKVVSHDDGYVTILHSTGGGQVPLSQLPDDLQKKYGYDPVKAAAAVRTDDAQLAASRVEIEHEQEKQEAKHKKEMQEASKKKTTTTP